MPHEEEYTLRKRLYLGNSWFGSVKTVQNIVNISNHDVFVVKTAYSRSKNNLHETMKEMPGGIWILLETTIDKEKLFSVGYKYNTTKLVICMCSWGAGLTEARSIRGKIPR